ncbi:MAG: hypothetical protein KF864_02985 [Phycisphaeraceae bacterium]|nr:hypothetical protein [Phycisphaeraceae bacterium]
MRNSVLGRVIAALFAVAMVTVAKGQCGVMLQDTVLPSDGSEHRTFFEWDFDGEGPLPPELLVGTGGGRVMAFNGTRWRQVGDRLSGPVSWNVDPAEPLVYQLLSFRGELHAVAAGYNVSSQGALFKWSGTQWDQIPMVGVGCPGSGATGHFRSATIWNDMIVVVGYDLRCSGQRLAIGWNGTAWAPLDNALTGFQSSSIVAAVHATSDGRLLIGGYLPTPLADAMIAELVGAQWQYRIYGYSGISSIPILRFQEIDGDVFAMAQSVEPIRKPRNRVAFCCV